ncbi:MAG: hypothetical protein A3E84_03585 [Gammaproteobacteria bacterium RIFCSPHIGHO2_12_FULL_42_13]|nr:MAG: hypothetical protein A3E84_03585 [Gammaproteobacteria bacterium RIFCSPHIGHO2_12_FULL_42_13]
MLEGQTYSQYFFEPNPPLILYLQMPVVILSKLTSIDILYIFRLYIICLILLSIACSHYFIKKLFTGNTLLTYAIFYILSYIFLILPADQFAQREHLAIIFVIPYLFSVASHLEIKNITSNFYILLFVGTLAGLGFAIKPHFLPALILVELYFTYKTGQFLGWVRTETIMITAILIFYPMTTFIMYPDYFHIVLPLWTPYYTAIAHPLSYVFLAHELTFCYIAVLLYLITRRIDHYKTTSSVFILAELGFIITFYIPRVTWYYHALPALSMALLLVTLLLGQLVQQHAKTQYRILLPILIGIFIFMSPFLISLSSTYKSMKYFQAERTWSQLVAFMKNLGPNNSFDYFSVSHELCLLEYYAHANFVGSFPYFVWEYNRPLLKYRPTKYAYIYQVKTVPYIINRLASNISDHKPKYIIVDALAAKLLMGTNLNYLKELSQSTIFQAVWKPYQYLTSINQYQIYKRNER